MVIEFSDHALSQLKNRPNIKKSMVEKTIKYPDGVITSFRSRRLFRRRFKDQILEVVTVKEDNKLVVITEYFLESES